MGYWGGVICGCCASAILFCVMMFSVIAQNNDLKTQIKSLEAKVEKHDEIMQAYAFYNWHATLKMDTEDLGK